MKVLLLLALTICAFGENHGDKDLRNWRYSVIPVVVTSATDVMSSRGLVELNPIIGRGEFGGRQVAAKAVGVGVLLGVEYLVVRKWPRSARMFRTLNFGYAGVTAGVSIHNWRQR